MPTRRDFFQLALTALHAEYAHGQPQQPHFAPRAKSVIFLFMDGGVSHLDSFDPKPRVQKRLASRFPWRARNMSGQ